MIFFFRKGVIRESTFLMTPRAKFPYTPMFDIICVEGNSAFCMKRQGQFNMEIDQTIRFIKT